MVTYKPKKVLFQTGFSNPNWDVRYTAKYPGRRVSAAGNVYYEYRRNRSDIDRKARY